jgi:hypothetical protein
MVFHISKVTSGAVRASGLRSSALELGGSVAKARAAKVSWNKLIHMSWTGVRTDCSSELEMADTKASNTEVTVMVIWN